MQVTYIHHSCFLVETNTVNLLFDYFEGELPDRINQKPLIVFSSHRHGDHFSSEIFSLNAAYYILSDDIWKKRVPSEYLARTNFVTPHKELYLKEENVKITTYSSTDEGVAFVVEADGITIYHAGDLNNWYWKEEGEQWNQWVSEKYHEELKKIAVKSVDIAFVPLDGRLEEGFFLGIDEFMKTVGAAKVFPMHFWGDFFIIDRFLTLKCTQDYREKIMRISHRGERFQISEKELN